MRPGAWIVGAAVGKYAPLELHYSNGNRAWRIGFATRPEREVLVSGDEPTADEILEVLLQVDANKCFPVVLSILATHLWRLKK